MKLVVLGATGGIGLEMVRQAMERGHAVTAFVRSPGALKKFDKQLAVIRGDVLNRSELRTVMQGHDAVLSGFGPRVPVSRADATLLQRFAGCLTNAMKDASVRRVAMVSTAFLFKDSIVPPTYLFGRMFYPGVVRDASEMEKILRVSNLDWTIVRPPRLTDKPPSGNYRSRNEHLPGFGFSISRADVADFMLRSVENRTHVGRVVGVCN